MSVVSLVIAEKLDAEPYQDEWWVSLIIIAILLVLGAFLYRYLHQAEQKEINERHEVLTQRHRREKENPEKYAPRDPKHIDIPVRFDANIVQMFVLN